MFPESIYHDNGAICIDGQDYTLAEAIALRTALQKAIEDHNNLPEKNDER